MCELSRTQRLKDKFRSRSRLYGCWTTMGHPQIVDTFCLIDQVDFVSVDMEHGAIDYELALRLISTIQGHNKCCLPRIDSHNRPMIKKLLDCGADGVIVPLIETVDELRGIVNGVKYPPVGSRNYGVNRAHKYGSGFGDYVERWNDSSVIVIQIETARGVDNVDALIADPNVDGVMIGPYDLSGSLGVPGQLDHPRVMEAIKHVSAKCLEKNMTIGTHLVYPTRAEIERSIRMGQNMNVLSSDVFILGHWCQEMSLAIESVSC